jgi:anion-transporting  ArsA/GET3 family ATPase
MTDLATLIDEAAVIVCAGCGGVGKTTIAATIALEAAKRGRRAVVVTIDPAKRLADALGLQSLSNEPQVVTVPDSTVCFSALMLDTPTTFDELVRRYSADADQAERILTNRFYRNISGALSGTQEYMAAEKLYALHDDDRFDVVVVDTPPTRNALDFLDAPGRLTRFLDHRIYRALTAPSRFGLKIANVAAQTVLKTIGRIVGGAVIADVIGFFQAFDGMEAGFRDRASQVIALLHADTTHYVLIASPRKDTVAEACAFAARLADQDLVVSGVVVNQLQPDFTDVGSDSDFGSSQPSAGHHRGEGTTVGVDPDDVAAQARRAIDDNLVALRRFAAEQRVVLAPLLADTPQAIVVEVPMLDHDVHDLAGLTIIGGYLLGRRRPPDSRGPDL